MSPTKKQLDQHVFHFKDHINIVHSLEPLWVFPRGCLLGSAPTSPKAGHEVVQMLLSAICLLRGWGMHPYDSIPWRRKSIMKILSFDNTLEYVPEGSDSTENLMTSMARHWSWFVWHIDINMYIYMCTLLLYLLCNYIIYYVYYIYKQYKWGQAITGIDYMNTLGWQTAGMHIYHIYIYTIYTQYSYIYLYKLIYVYNVYIQDACKREFHWYTGYQPFSVERN